MHAVKPDDAAAMAAMMSPGSEATAPAAAPASEAAAPEAAEAEGNRVVLNVLLEKRAQEKADFQAAEDAILYKHGTQTRSERRRNLKPGGSLLEHFDEFKPKGYGQQAYEDLQQNIKLNRQFKQADRQSMVAHAQRVTQGRRMRAAASVWESLGRMPLSKSASEPQFSFGTGAAREPPRTASGSRFGPSHELLAVGPFRRVHPTPGPGRYGQDGGPATPGSRRATSTRFGTEEQRPATGSLNRHNGAALSPGPAKHVPRGGGVGASLREQAMSGSTLSRPSAYTMRPRYSTPPIQPAEPAPTAPPRRATTSEGVRSAYGGGASGRSANYPYSIHKEPYSGGVDGYQPRGHRTPGPKYDKVSSIGMQPDSGRRSPPRCCFGTSPARIQVTPGYKPHGPGMLLPSLFSTDVTPGAIY